MPIGGSEGRTGKLSANETAKRFIPLSAFFHKLGNWFTGILRALNMGRSSVQMIANCTAALRRKMQAFGIMRPNLATDKLVKVVAKYLLSFLPTDVPF